MEKIAITEWNGVVSPVYDMACRMLLLDGQGVTAVRDVSTLSIIEKSLFCEKEQIATLLCGAISARALHLLDERGIRVIPWICGSVERIAAAYYEGIDIVKRFAMPGTVQPGCGKGRRWCGGTLGARRCRTGQKHQKQEDRL